MSTVNRVSGAAMIELIDMASHNIAAPSVLDERIIERALHEASRAGGELTRRQVSDIFAACLGRHAEGALLAEIFGGQARITYPMPSPASRAIHGMETMPLVEVVGALLRAERLGAVVCLDRPLEEALESIKRAKGKRSRVTQAEIDVIWAGHQRGKAVEPERVACKQAGMPSVPEPSLWTSPAGFTMHLEGVGGDLILSAYSPAAAKQWRQELEWQRQRIASRPSDTKGITHHA